MTRMKNEKPPRAYSLPLFHPCYPRHLSAPRPRLNPLPSSATVSDCRSMDLKSYLVTRHKEVDRALDRFLPSESTSPATIHKAMRYSVFAGGKRLRPILCLAAAEACGGKIRSALPLACALECNHTYSLVHDDLPSMDNDDFRRGRA